MAALPEGCHESCWKWCEWCNIILVNLLFFQSDFSFILISILSSVGFDESQLVRGWQDRSEVWGAFRVSAPATFVSGDHLWTFSLGELSHQRGQPRDGRLWTLLQWRKQRRDEQPNQPTLQTWIFWDRPCYHCRWAEAVFWGGKWGDAEPFPPSLCPWCCPALLHPRGLSYRPPHIPGSRLVTSPGLDLSPPADAKPLLPLLPELSPLVVSWGEMDQEASCCDGGNVLLLRIYLRILNECLL